MNDIFSVNDKQVLSNLAEMGARLKQLAEAVENAKVKLHNAEAEYQNFAQVQLPMLMFNAGVSSIALTDGGELTINRKFYCSPNKNPEDRQRMTEFLAEHGASDIINHSAVVKDLDALERSGIPYTPAPEVNTSKLKAWLKDALGYNGGTPKFNIEDIPQCVHFSCVEEATIN
ncbi:MAG: hypothetical protein Pg6A_19810 [Termitinemataceae bacterium]|nr:MAG: hypothetical protein Pg6A_19810 [Termitinemataceae bacterium]